MPVLDHEELRGELAFVNEPGAGGDIRLVGPSGDLREVVWENLSTRGIDLERWMSRGSLLAMCDPVVALPELDRVGSVGE